MSPKCAYHRNPYGSEREKNVANGYPVSKTYDIQVVRRSGLPGLYLVITGRLVFSRIHSVSWRPVSTRANIPRRLEKTRHLKPLRSLQIHHIQHLAHMWVTYIIKHIMQPLIGQNRRIRYLIFRYLRRYNFRCEHSLKSWRRTGCIVVKCLQF